MPPRKTDIPYVEGKVQVFCDECCERVHPHALDPARDSSSLTVTNSGGIHCEQVTTVVAIQGLIAGFHTCGQAATTKVSVRFRDTI